MNRFSSIFKKEKRINPRICSVYRYIFVHIPKTAGNSVGTALKRLPRDNKLPGSGFRIKKHAKAYEIKNIVGENIWSEYFSFCFVRNPWDLMVSSYHWWLHSGYRFRHTKKMSREIKKMNGFGDFIKSEYGRKMINECYGNLYDWISEDENIVIDFIGKFENLNNDWHQICLKSGISFSELPVINKSPREDYRIYYDRETKQIIENRFARSINYFKYSF